MNRCAEILADVLERSGLDRTDGNPLYAYRITPDELERLRVELESRLFIAQKLRTAEECAAFCLYASEWFRRRYERGVWSWGTIFDGFQSLEPGVVAAVQGKRGEYTIDGLKWWHRDVIRTAASRRYLTTLVCEGGFPLNTLRNDAANLSRVLRQCLRQHELYPSEPIGEVVDEFIGYLPETLQEPEVRYLLGSVTTAIADLRKQSDDAVSQGLSRRDFLDQTVPGWHEKFPFRIEDEEGQALMLSLLDARNAQVFDQQPLAIVTALAEQDGRLRLQRTLKHPVTIESDDFRRLCGLRAEATLYPRMNGFLNAGETRVQACTVAKPFEGTTLRVQTAGVAKLIGPEAAQKTTLLVRSGQEPVADAGLPGGEALPVSPWVFNADDPYELIGVGSIRTRRETVYVALPGDATIEGDAEATEHIVDDRPIHCVSGNAEVQQQETLFRICTRDKDSTDTIYELSGLRRRIGTGSEYWLGRPSIVEMELTEHAKPRLLGDHEVKWRPSNGGQWQRFSDECLGEVLVRADVDGECKLQSRITVMPADFRLTTRPSNAVDQGQWVFSGLKGAELYFEPHDQVEMHGSRQGDDTVVDVRVTGTRPESIRAKVRFSEHCIAELKLVCPTQSCELVGIGGRVLNSRIGVPSEQLDGMRVRMIQPGGQQPYVLELEHSQVIDRLTETSPGVWEYPLSFIKDRAIGLLAASDDPDGEIHFGVSVGRSLNPSFRWRISRYGFRLEPVRYAYQSEEERETEYQECRSHVQVSDPDLRSLLTTGVQVRVIALNDPKYLLPEEAVTTVGPGQWTINHAETPAGYYLVTGKTENSEILRPLRIASKPEQVVAPPSDKPEEEYSFDEVSTIRSRDRRREVWDHFFDRMANDFGHSDWTKVQNVVEASMTLPITTFEAVAGLTRNSIAVAKYGILEPGNVRLWQRLEELPFLWCLVPVDSWITSAFRILNYFHDAMDVAGIPEEQIGSVIKDKSEAFAKLAPDRNPSMACIAACLFHAGLVSPSLLIMAGTSPDDYQQSLASLVSRHDKFDSRVTWPNPRLNISPQVRDLLYSTPDLINRETHANQWAVINAPAIAAVYSTYGLTLEPKLVQELKRLRSFDTAWFDSANHYAMFRVMTRRFEEETDWVEKVVERESRVQV